MKKRFNLKLVASIVLLGVLVLNIQYALTGYNGADVFARQSSQSNTSSDGTGTAILGVATYTTCDSRYDISYTSGQTLVLTYQVGAGATNLSYIGSVSGGYGASYTYYSSQGGVIQAESRNCPGYGGFCTHKACGE